MTMSMDDSADPGRGRTRLRTGLLVVVVSLLVMTGLLSWLSVGAKARAARALPVATQIPTVVEPDTPQPSRSASAEPAARQPESVPQPDPGWLRSTAGATGIPQRALQAYATASLAVAGECGLAWNTLAAIGAVESAHGSHGGSVLGADGRISPEIRGPVLNGVGTGRIGDTDGGELDGDRRWDRAMGPLQFIPSTWRAWGSDGNGDGLADPDQIDDAALSAARYLCASGDLRTDAGWRDAIWAYNHSWEYVSTVAQVATGYAEAVS